MRGIIRLCRGKRNSSELGRKWYDVSAYSRTYRSGLYERSHAAHPYTQITQRSIDAVGLHVAKRQRPKKFATLGAVDLIGANMIRKASSSKYSSRSEEVLPIPSLKLK